MEEGDEDFGDLYADVEVEASSAMNVAPQFSQLQFVSDDTGKQSSVLEASCDNEDGAGDGVDGYEEEEEDDDDDLNIVLNSDDDSIRHGDGFTIARNNTNLRSRELEDEDDDNLGTEEFMGGKSVDNSHSLYKYRRSQSAAYDSDLKGTGCGAAAYLSREDNGYCQRMGSRSTGPQSGQRFSLPRARNILDVNIDIFEHKPWKHPGADITDYFNFGFNEDSWKLYCNQVDEYRHRGSMSSGTHASEPVQLMETKAYEGGFGNEIVARDVWGKSESRQRRGRAIQVEDSIVERQSSMDVRRQLDRDSDVIQITILDREEQLSGSAKEELGGDLDSSVPEALNHGDVSGDDGMDHLSFSSVSEDESVERNHLEMEINASKRSSDRRSRSKPVTTVSENNEFHQISDVYEHQCSRIDICGSGGTDEAIRTSDNTKEKTGEETCTTDPSMLVAESSEAERSHDGASIDRWKSYSHERRPSTTSFTDLTPSVKHGYHHSKDSRKPDDKRAPGQNRYHARHASPVYNEKNHGDFKRRRHDENDKRKHGDARCNARCNSPVYNNRTHRDPKFKPHQENDDFCSRGPVGKRKPCERRYHARHSSPVNNRRNCGVPKLKAHHENDDSFPMSDIEGTYDVHSTVGHNRRNERFHAFDPYDVENISYSKESELPLDYYGERFSGYEDWDTLARDLHWKDYDRFEAKMDQFVFRNSEEDEYYGGRRRYIEDNEMNARDWCDNERELAVENVDFFSSQEFGWHNSKYPPNMKYKKGAQWKRKGDNMQFRNKGEDDEFFLEREYTDDIQGEKFRSFTYNGRERDDFERRYVKHIAYTKWEFRGPGRNKSRVGSPSYESNTFLPKRDEDRYLRYEEDHSFASRSSEESYINNGKWSGNMMPRNNSYGRHRRYRGQLTERFRYDDSLGGHPEPFDREDYTIDIGDRVDMGRKIRHNWQSEMQLKEDEVTLRDGHTKFCAERASFSFEKVPRRKRLVSEHEPDLVEELIDDPHVEGHNVEGRKYRPIERTSDVTRGGSHERSFMDGRDSLDSRLVDGSDHFEELIKGRRAEGCRYKQTRKLISGNKCSKTVKESHEQLSPSCRNLLDSSLVAGEGKSSKKHGKAERMDLDPCSIEKKAIDEGLDIEEGQILTEEANAGPTKNDTGAHVNDANKPRSQKGNTGFDNPRILEAIAKMEKRRARFNEPIATTKELKDVGSAQETASNNQQRPARKRRWGGS